MPFKIRLTGVIKTVSGNFCLTGPAAAEYPPATLDHKDLDYA
jgi:hypothetical protein